MERANANHLVNKVNLTHTSMGEVRFLRRLVQKLFIPDTDAACMNSLAASSVAISCVHIVAPALRVIRGKRAGIHESFL